MPKGAVVTAAAALGAIGLVALLVGFGWWLVAWGRKDEGELRSRESRIDELERAVEDRDRAIAHWEQASVRDKAALAATEEQRASAIKLVEELAAKSPAVVSHAIRDQLARLRALSQVPKVPPSPAGEAGGGTGGVHGAPTPG